MATGAAGQQVARPRASTAASSPRRPRPGGPARCARAAAASKRSAGDEQRAGVAGADLAQHVGRDDGRDQAEPGLGEAERAPARGATATSQQATRPAPPPSAAPWTRATTGFGQRVDRLQHRASARGVGDVLVRRVRSREPRIQPRSAPAQNERPAPGQHDSPASRPRASAANAASAPRSAPHRARCRRRGRSSVTQAAAPPARADAAPTPLTSGTRRISVSGTGAAWRRRGPGRARAACRAGRSCRRPTAGRCCSRACPRARTCSRIGASNASCSSARGPRRRVQRVETHGEQAGLLAAHHRDARVRPHPELARRVGAAAHAVVAGAERAADDHRELGHLARRPPPSPAWRRPWRCRRARTRGRP